MALKTLVKVGEITNLSDARYCAGMGVEMLGFNIDPISESYVSPEQFKEITEWVAGVKFVGEFGLTDLTGVKQRMIDYNLDFVQLKNENAHLAIDISLPVILEVNQNELLRVHDNVSYYLLNSLTNINDLIAPASVYPILLGCEVNEQNVNNLITRATISGIALKGSKEEKPGYKDYDELADILEALEVED